MVTNVAIWQHPSPIRLTVISLLDFFYFFNAQSKQRAISPLKMNYNVCLVCSIIHLHICSVYFKIFWEHLFVIAFFIFSSSFSHAFGDFMCSDEGPLIIGGHSTLIIEAYSDFSCFLFGVPIWGCYVASTLSPFFVPAGGIAPRLPAGYGTCPSNLSRESTGERVYKAKRRPFNGTDTPCSLLAFPTCLR
jgi:hypothetical protein